MTSELGTSRKAVSLFTGAGIGDVGFRESGIEFVVMNELEPTRAAIAKANFPETQVIEGDLWHRTDEIVAAARQAAPQGLFLVTCTAPCQGMSKNGQGTLLRNARAGKRPHLDPRNRLILPALKVIRALDPQWVVFENVSEMANTLIEDDEGDLRPILECIDRALAPRYSGRAYDLEFADYGVSQRRRRLITVYSRSEHGVEYLARGGEFAPATTHSQRPRIGQEPWVTVSDAISGFPPLDAASREAARHPSIPFHRVPLLDERKYWWVSATPAGSGAFDNQCTACGFEGNATHGNRRNAAGINQAKKTTPVYCERCGALLPRPSVEESDGTSRIMSGYTSAYKRMAGNLPAPALTRNLSYACSDQKLHPTQNRVLSLAEAFEVHSLSRYGFSWESNGKTIRDGLIALVLGESVPPHLTELIGHHVQAVHDQAAPDPREVLNWPTPVTGKSTVLLPKVVEPPEPEVEQIAVWA